MLAFPRASTRGSNGNRRITLCRERRCACRFASAVHLVGNITPELGRKRLSTSVSYLHGNAFVKVTAKPVGARGGWAGARRWRAVWAAGAAGMAGDVGTSRDIQEGWAAHFAQRMAHRIAEALAAGTAQERRAALGEALELGKEARLQLEAGPTQSAAERQALSHLQRALDETQAALNRFDICDNETIRRAWEDAARAAECLGAG